MKLPFGPGALVAAAFIGPGTVTACTVAGADFGFSLVWALVFATLATVILQSMSARLGVVGQVGLGEAMASGDDSPFRKWAAGGLVLTALLAGTAAYEAGNIAGGAVGLDTMFGTYKGVSASAHTLIIAGVAAAALLTGRYKILERLLISLVILMSLAFAASFVLVRPDIPGMVSGIMPRIPVEPEGGLLRTIALIGTTIVPYNLFLHAAAARNRWSDSQADLNAALRDTRFSIGLGGLISILILSTAASTLFAQGVTVTNGADMALALEPVAGARATFLIGLGLFAAGLTSAITAPMAAAYAVTELVPAARANRGLAFRVVALSILAIGVVVGLAGYDPVTLILVAQLANGLLLPIVAVFLLIAMNRESLLGARKNTLRDNVLGGGVVLVCGLLGMRVILRAIGVWP